MRKSRIELQTLKCLQKNFFKVINDAKKFKINEIINHEKVFHIRHQLTRNAQKSSQSNINKNTIDVNDAKVFFNTRLTFCKQHSIISESNYSTRLIRFFFMRNYSQI